MTWTSVVDIITSTDDRIRHTPIEEVLERFEPDALREQAQRLERFRRDTGNLYHKVRASLMLFAVYRYGLMDRGVVPCAGTLPVAAVHASLERRYEQAIDLLHAAVAGDGPNEALYSALADAYYHLGFRYLVDQVHDSIRASQSNEQLFTTTSLADYTLRAPKEVTKLDRPTGLFPLGFETTAVRADPCHSGWSDIFFLGMDYPEGARVVNVSVDLAVAGRDETTRPPIEVYCRMIDRPVIRLTSTDIGETKDIQDLEDLFNFANDHLGLLKAGIVAGGLIPPGMKSCTDPLPAVLATLLQKQGGFELVTKVNGIPKGSRLAVSTTLLAAIITRCMRFSGQTRSLTGPLDEDERRLVASRAILGEWLGGSGGGWQDSGGIWPGIKVITGSVAHEGDPEFGVSRGRLLPQHQVLGGKELAQGAQQRLAASMVMVHGGMAQNVGPILEMVTERYLLRHRHEWEARQLGQTLFEQIVWAVCNGDMKQLGKLTTDDYRRVTQPIIPWVHNAFTADVNAALRERFGDDYWGFLMLGGMAGGGMAHLVDPARRSEFVLAVESIMREVKRRYEDALPFAMEPVVYDFEVNHRGIVGHARSGAEALLPNEYYRLQLLQKAVDGDDDWVTEHRGELAALGASLGVAEVPETADDIAAFYEACFGEGIRETLSLVQGGHPDWEATARQLKRANGFDPDHHAELRERVRSGEISLSNNRLPADTVIEDVRDEDVTVLEETAASSDADRLTEIGQSALGDGRVAVVTFAAGVGSRWTEGAGVVKTVNPFAEMMGRHRSFAEIHLAKSRRSSSKERPVQHVFTTSFLTHPAMEKHLALTGNYGYPGKVYLSPARSIGQRLFPTERDLRFLWEEMPEQQLSEHAQRVRDDLRRTLIGWAKQKGEACDYNENIPEQRFYPPGHWYEIPNLLRNGTLGQMLIDNPELDVLMAHNADTLGAWLDPLVVGLHLDGPSAMTFEVTTRRIEDVGGGLAHVNGRPRLLEGSALPRQDDEYRLRYYNTLTTWIGIDTLLDYLGVTREDIVAVAGDDHRACRKLDEALRKVESQMPTYLTIKNVKLRWGAGQEDVFPVCQCEKLWGDMTALDDLSVDYLVVPRKRGQQLKDPALLDHWVRDGSKAHVQSLCLFPEAQRRRRGRPGMQAPDIRPGRPGIDPRTQKPIDGHPY